MSFANYSVVRHFYESLNPIHIFLPSRVSCKGLGVISAIEQKQLITPGSPPTHKAGSETRLRRKS